MDKKQQKRISKRLSLHLRHDPAGLDLTLEPGGWVNVDELLVAFSKKYFPITRQDLQEVVKDNDKQRFGFDETGANIRARQGHSAKVDLQLESSLPPDTLYHGTAQQSLNEILRTGIKPMKRQHVHLSTDKETMLAVARRHGEPVLLSVDARNMHEAGHLFYLSDNNIWLSDFVPASYVKRDKVKRDKA